MAKMFEQSNLKPEMMERKKVLTLSTKKEVNKGAWTPDEDRKLAEVIAVHGAKKWKTIATIAGLNRCGKSCRLRWLNYLRPNIKRGNISDQEEDLILRLHKLLGNRWSLIAGRLPGRTDNEIKNYWNSHLSKRIINQKDEQSGASSTIIKSEGSKNQRNKFHQEVTNKEDNNYNIAVSKGSTGTDNQDSNSDDFDVNDFFDFSSEGPTNSEWMTKFLERDRAELFF